MRYANPMNNRPEHLPRLVWWLLVAILTLLTLAAAHSICFGDSVVLAPAADNTLIQDGTNNLSNGAGDYFFTGRTDQGNIRRGLIRFDVAAAIPPGSTITGATLTLLCSRAKVNTGYAVELHRVLAAWGEGTANAGGQEGSGAAAVAGDVSWFYRLYATSAWSAPGGDFSATISASTLVGANGQSYNWSGAGMVADLQAWLNTPVVNQGWALVGGEGVATRSAKRYNSRTNTTSPPRLVVTYTPPAGQATGACCLPDESCTVVDSFACAAQGGAYQGDDTDCSPDPCGNAPITITLLAMKDNTLYEDAGGTLSNGAGDYFFSGRNNQSLRRRGLVAFSLAGQIPSNAVVSAASLVLRSTQGGGGSSNVAAHRVLADWGEGASNASGGEGSGAASATGDATWIHRFFNTSLWSTAGGQYSPTASASTTVADQNFYSWSGAGMVADVQAWVGGTGNFGWALVGIENAGTTEKRFASRQYATDATFRPRLTITYTVSPPVPTGACCFASGDCDALTEEECAAQGGTYHGDGTLCSPELCPVILTPFVDALTVPPVAVPTSGVVGGVASYEMRMVEFKKKLHRDLPATTVWGYNGYYPGPTIVASTGQPVTVDWINDLRDSTGALRTRHYLPVDFCLHGPDTAGAGARVVVHLHGGHVPQAVDGHPDSTFTPGQSRTYTYPNNQPAALIWYHDHALGTTRLNVMMGLAGGYVVTDPVEAALNLPSGAHDVPLILQDRRFHPDGSLDYPAAWEEHFFGDVALVNGTVWPYANVDRGAYRFRLLNGSNSRSYILHLSNGRPFTVIGNDGGLLEHPVRRDSLLITPGERIDTIVDFSGLPAGTEVLLRNTAASPYPSGDAMHPALPEIMKFVVQATPGLVFTPPATLRPITRLDPATADMARDFSLEKMPDACTGQMWMINGLHWDDITERPRLGDTEVWRYINRSGVVHPMHMHLVHFLVLDRTPVSVEADTLVFGTPVPPDSVMGGWKDTVPVLPGEAVRVIARFDDYTGRYAYHCHILEHEDHEMMRQFEVVDTLVTAVPEPPAVSIVPRLDPGYPNPVTGVTRISFELPDRRAVRLDVFDVAGRLVATLADDTLPAGRHEVRWEGLGTDGRRLPAGLYFYRLGVAGHADLSRKLLIVN